MQRNTWQRDAVRSALNDTHGFVSAQQLHETLQESGSPVGLATVYRTLKRLEEAGEADALQSPDGENLFRSCVTTGHHHHLICRVCGTTRELSATVVEEWTQRVAKEHGFRDIEHIVDLFGVCEDCQSRAKGDRPTAP